MPPVVIAAAIAGGATLYAGSQSSKAAKQAASAQTAATQQGIDTQLQMYQQSREDQTPWRQVGSNALQQLAYQTGLPGYTGGADFQKTPGYQFRFNEGVRARDQAAATGGMLRSGARLKALTKYGQDIGSEEYGNWMNRLGTLAGVGQTATGQQQQANTQNAQALGDLYGNAGAARASGYVGQAAATTNTVNQLSGLAGMFANQGYGGAKQTQQVPWALYNQPAGP